MSMIWHRAPSLVAILFQVLSWIVFGILRADAATIIVVNEDSAHEGLNDSTPFAIQCDNTAATLGQARLQAAIPAGDVSLVTVAVHEIIPRSGLLYGSRPDDGCKARRLGRRLRGPPGKHGGDSGRFPLDDRRPAAYGLHGGSRGPLGGDECRGGEHPAHSGSRPWRQDRHVRAGAPASISTHSSTSAPTSRPFKSWRPPTAASNSTCVSPGRSSPTLAGGLDPAA
jgi:hypothetical protein